jgi:hypothetical protein
MRKTTCIKTILLALSLCTIAACSGSSCDENKAYNKMLALNKIQGRLLAKGGDVGTPLGLSLTNEIGAVSEFIARKDYAGACAKADELAKKLGADLDNEQKGMITYEQLKVDGGKGSGSCSIADAAKKQMEVHGLLQAEVDAGRMDSDIFRTFNEDTVGFAEMLSTNPSAACELLDRLKTKYKLK